MWKVMAADDEAYIREALQKLINWEKRDCVLSVVANNGQELIEQMGLEHPDIVITDIKMPVLDGLEVCKYIYETSPETQVILLTAYSDFEYAKRAIRYNACDYVLKISVLEELPMAVERAINKLERKYRELEGERSANGGQGALYAQMEKYIEQNYRKKISLDEMSEALHANRSYLSRLYKSKTGINLFDAIAYRKIDAAKEYLLNSDRKTYEISEALGFEDAGYFSRVFKKQTGVSPKEYRKRGENE